MSMTMSKMLMLLVVFVMVPMLMASPNEPPKVDTVFNCGPHQVREICAHECQPTCPEYDQDGKLLPEPEVCIKECLLDCNCESPYLRKFRKSNECVLKKDCPPPPKKA